MPEQKNNPFNKIMLGVVRLDGWGDPRTTGTGEKDESGAYKEGTAEKPLYVPIRGDVDDELSYVKQDFDVEAVIAKGCSWGALCNKDAWTKDHTLKTAYEGLRDAFKVLIENEADAIIANCGLFMWCHAKGLVDPALDAALGDSYSKKGKPRPIIALSTLTMIPSLLPLCGLGLAHRKEIDHTIGLINELENGCITKQNPGTFVIFTSNEDACVAILQNIPELEDRVTIFTHNGKEELAPPKDKGGILVVGLNGKNVIGVNGEVEGFEIVTDGTPAIYSILEKSIKKVAEGVKKEYPETAMALIECTEVGAYSDTIRHALSVPVYDPIHLANTLIDTIKDHQYKQLDYKHRQMKIQDVMRVPFNEKNLPKGRKRDSFYIPICSSNDDETNKKQKTLSE